MVVVTIILHHFWRGILLIFQDSDWPPWRPRVIERSFLEPPKDNSGNTLEGLGVSLALL